MTKGIRFDRKKITSLISWTLAASKNPSRSIRFVPKEGTIKVKTGEVVKTAQLIALVPRQGYEFPIYSSSTGAVKGIGFYPHPFCQESWGIEIQGDQREERPLAWTEDSEWTYLNPEGCFNRILNGGVTNLGWPETVLCEDIAEARRSRVSEIHICISDLEPYLTCHESLVFSHPLEILKGAEILRNVAGAQRLVFIFDEDQSEACELIKSKVFFLKWTHCDFVILAPLYPSRRDYANAFAEFSAPAAFAVYEAVAKQKPFFERPVTVAGECVIEPRNRWVRLGTSMEEAVKWCRGLLREPNKLIMNGAISGVAQPSLDRPIVSGTSGVLALPFEVSGEETVSPCTQCGECIEVCPEDLSPAMITRAAEHQDWELAELFGASSCTLCGNCAYICPSKRPMIQLIQSAAGSDDID